ncbi:carotenoid biosynthesis protein [Actinobacillus arthritidis]|uniref:carotenoid biosynthesis protein n=1 Tax=Actinobacillus arthritidis TaxID=157339 RepID=UPI002442A4DD|nr:carotenoid biosynthesis protein [Actinobacillus arthritidis]WGE89933.1 carotenoid biosynthesis protein [Actinobacillus arthritidis]
MTQKQYTNLNIGRWLLIGIMFVLTAYLLFAPEMLAPLGPLFAILIAVFAFWHGYQRFGAKNMIIFFLITWIISHFFESLSVSTGFPFGHYHYKALPGPRIANVPLIIMPAYFAMGYTSYILGQVLTGQYGKKLQDIHIFITPFVATFIMVMWDVLMDPLATTINQSWVWRDSGAYFGVPLSNFVGWFFVVYLFMQLFLLYLAKYDKMPPKNYDNAFWLEAVAVYAIKGLSFIIPAFVLKSNVEMNGSIALISVFTMMFVALLSVINIFTMQVRTS